MINKFRLTQLYKSSEAEFIKGTCHIHDNEDGDRFECSIKGDREFKAQLWQHCEGSWPGRYGIPCTVEFTEVNSNGVPTDGVITEIEGFLFIATNALK